MSFARAVAFVLAREKGLVDDPKDPGGLTNFGIALRRHPEFTAQQVRDMTPSQAAEIYHGPQYWGAIHGDELPDALQLPMLDTAVVEGPATAAKCLQRALGLPDDGVVGPVTLKAARVLASATLLEKFGAERIVEMSNCQNWPHDRRGWSRRVIASCVENLS